MGKCYKEQPLKDIEFYHNGWDLGREWVCIGVPENYCHIGWLAPAIVMGLPAKKISGKTCGKFL